MDWPATSPSAAQLPPSVRVMVPACLTETVSGVPAVASLAITSPLDSVITAPVTEAIV